MAKRRRSKKTSPAKSTSARPRTRTKVVKVYRTRRKSNPSGRAMLAIAAIAAGTVLAPLVMAPAITMISDGTGVSSGTVGGVIGAVGLGAGFMLADKSPAAAGGLAAVGAATLGNSLLGAFTVKEPPVPVSGVQIPGMYGVEVPALAGPPAPDSWADAALSEPVFLDV